MKAGGQTVRCRLRVTTGFAVAVSAVMLVASLPSERTAQAAGPSE